MTVGTKIFFKFLTKIKNLPKNLEVSFVSVTLVTSPNTIADVIDQSFPITNIIKNPVAIQTNIKPTVDIAII